MNGAAPAITAVLGGHVDLTFIGTQVIKTHLEAGTLRALAILHPKRVKIFPEIPNGFGKGFPKLTNMLWIRILCACQNPSAGSSRNWEMFSAVY